MYIKLFLGKTRLVYKKTYIEIKAVDSSLYAETKTNINPQLLALNLYPATVNKQA